jgi:acetyl esterase/lipase
MKVHTLLATFLLFKTMSGQSQSQQGTSVTYVHNEPASFKSRYLQTLMAILGKKNTIEKRIKSGKFNCKAAKPPKDLLSNYHVQEKEVNRRTVWVIQPKQQRSQKIILYVHGGGYISNLTKYDWGFIRELVDRTNCAIIVPDYPLAPSSNYKDVYAFFDKLYPELLSENSNENIVLMGNSAGAGIALGFAQKLRNDQMPQPTQIILNSPWLDITMSNPEIASIERKDKLLGVKGLKMAGQLYAADLDATDYRVSPIYGDFSGLGKISIFIGTHDLFLADSRKFKQMMNVQGISVNYFEYPRMFHVWIVLTSLKESQHVIRQIEELINL